MFATAAAVDIMAINSAISGPDSVELLLLPFSLWSAKSDLRTAQLQHVIRPTPHEAAQPEVVTRLGDA